MLASLSLRSSDLWELRTEFFLTNIQDWVLWINTDATFTEERIRWDINELLQEYSMVSHTKYAWWVNIVEPEDLSDELHLNQKQYKELLIEAKFALQELDEWEKLHYKNRYTHYIGILYKMVILHIIDSEIYQQLDPPDMV
jgi:hypothetical protein